jgi:hypothetical protein
MPIEKVLAISNLPSEREYAGKNMDYRLTFISI